MVSARCRLSLLCLIWIAGCGLTIDPASLPNASITRVDVGKRLGKTLSPEALETIGRDESTLLRSLTTAERRSFAQGYLRFKVDRRVWVDVAVPDARPPFWLKDLGFQATKTTLSHSLGGFSIWTRRFDAGVVGLGVNSLDRRPRGHYVVFVRGEGATPRVDLIDADRANVVNMSEGLSPYQDDARPFRSLPEPLRTAVLIQPRLDQRHATAVIRGKVWKTRLPSGPAADQVVVSFGENPTNSLAWTWRTDPSVTASEVRLERANRTNSQRVSGEFVKVESDGLLNDPIIHRHRVSANGLEPDTTYRYALRDGSANGWTDWKTARTAPSTDRDYSFLTMGDPQCGLEEWGRLLASASSRHPTAGFLVIAGDLVDRGNERSNWDHFFMRAEGVFERLPLVPCVGNHEYLDKGPTMFASSFVLPTNGPRDVAHRLTYAFEYSDSFVAVLDSNPAVYSRQKAERLADWLDGELARTKARWKFVVFHHPVYPSHPSREQPQLAAAWVPVFEKHKVDIVFQGHDHAYLRTYPMRAGQPAVPSSEGTTYVVSVSGQKFVPLAERRYTSKGFANVATYQTIEISPLKGSLVYRALDVDGIERDRFEIAKPRTLNVSAVTRDPRE